MTDIPKKLLIIGDSGVYGWGDLDGGGWCERLRKNWMNHPGAPIIYSLGVRGDGLEEVTKRWHLEWQSRGELRRKVPDGIILAVGLNDTAKIGKKNGRPKLTAEGYRFGLQQLIRRIKLQTALMVIGLTPVDEEMMPFAECLWYSNNSIEIYESQIEEVCLEEDIPFLSMYKEMKGEINHLSLINSDGIHLNSDGHYWIYQRVKHWKALLKWACLEERYNITSLYI